MKTATAAFAAIVLSGSFGISVEAADLFLRPAGAEGGSSMTVGVEETGAIEIVVRLEAGEELGFANIFLDVDDDDPLEALDFVPGLDAPPAVYTSHEQVLRNRFGPFPYPPGEGISIDEYALILDTGGVVGPGTFLLERIELFGSAAGVARVAFEFSGGRPPSLFDSDNNQYNLATPQVPPNLPGFVYVGVGDNRDGGAGPLAIAVEPESPGGGGGPPPPGGDNENDNVDDNDNDNGTQNPPDDNANGDDNANDNSAPDDGDNSNSPTPQGNNNDNDATPSNDNASGNGTPDDGGTPIDPAGEDNANGSDNGPGDPPSNSNASGSDDDPGGQDVPNANDSGDGNDNSGGSTPPPARRPCGFGMLPALVSLLAALGVTRQARRRRSR